MMLDFRVRGFTILHSRVGILLVDPELTFCFIAINSLKSMEYSSFCLTDINYGKRLMFKHNLFIDSA
ncbi:TPA: hypothetical protein G8C29_004779 [Salmonella enterica]|uniref:Uncharacterized protein n=1 Tax=Salmonella enterica TaxID=28901 RepID=A0A749C0I4_SALER|nr:hypothetical protein [Salmonella enterica subsp. enterica serovar Sandiego]ECJ6126496.1 hypothetical protein [Salmonella enterica]EEI7371492.1 hypothetical protein [Salmonella enterica]MLY08180.1 hypothetical protein [Salmonella enterica subsp. enterica serovar Sandiego]HAF5507100.1 hypothetical protein [Salmonella enterica]